MQSYYSLLRRPLRGGERIALDDALAADATLHDVTFVDAQHGWAVGDRGVIFATTDGGAHWQSQPSGVRCPLSGVCFISRTNGWAVGGGWKPYIHTSYGVALATDDGGLTWRRLNTPTLPLLRGVKFFDDQQGAAWAPRARFIRADCFSPTTAAAAGGCCRANARRVGTPPTSPASTPASAPAPAVLATIAERRTADA